MKLDWEAHRSDDGSINLKSAFKEYMKEARWVYMKPRGALSYISDIQKLQPIHSRQVAAVVLVSASLFKADEDV